jgi:hypothetical protein
MPIRNSQTKAVVIPPPTGTGKVHLGPGVQVVLTHLHRVVHRIAAHKASGKAEAAAGAGPRRQCVARGQGIPDGPAHGMNVMVDPVGQMDQESCCGAAHL